MTNRAEILKHKFQNSVGLPFAEVLCEQTITAVLEEHQVKYRQVLYTPIVVIWAWISQVLDEDSSLSNAVKRVVTWMAVSGAEIPSDDTGAYSKARKRLPLAILPPLFERTAKALSTQVQPSQLWCGRRVKAFDGTTVIMSDTDANQHRYPQHSHQKYGCGFPMLKLMVWFCLYTGAVVEVSMAPIKVSEWRLARNLYAKLGPNDVALADSAFGTYTDLAWVQLAGADGVFRKHYGRKCDFRRGKKLGVGDHIVEWIRPQQCPKSLSQKEFEALPESIKVREVCLKVPVRGFRPSKIIVVTTLLDAKRYPKAKLTELYQLRWQAAEVNLRHLKSTLNMEMIAAKTPDMVQKSIWMHLLAYNLLRTVMWKASVKKGLEALRISLQGTRQQLNHFRPELARGTQAECKRLYDRLLQLLGRLLVPLRPNRSEPRVVKLRAKAFPKMQQPRFYLKAQLAA